MCILLNIRQESREISEICESFSGSVPVWLGFRRRVFSISHPLEERGRGGRKKVKVISAVFARVYEQENWRVVQQQSQP